jgi:hypothetical protein
MDPGMPLQMFLAINASGVHLTEVVTKVSKRPTSRFLSVFKGSFLIIILDKTSSIV